VIAAVAAIRPEAHEAHEARMLVQSADDVVAIAPDGKRTRLLTGAGDAVYRGRRRARRQERTIGGVRLDITKVRGGVYWLVQRANSDIRSARAAQSVVPASNNLSLI
jgi:hypothetical protein